MPSLFSCAILNAAHNSTRRHAMNPHIAQLPYDFTAHLTHFCRVLRSHGLLVSPQETADVMRALSAVGHDGQGPRLLVAARAAAV